MANQQIYLVLPLREACSNREYNNVITTAFVNDIRQLKLNLNSKFVNDIRQLKLNLNSKSFSIVKSSFLIHKTSQASSSSLE